MFQEWQIHRTGNSTAVLPVQQPNVQDRNTQLAHLLQCAGVPNFYSLLAEFLSKIIDSERWIVLRSKAHDKPVVLTERGIGHEIIDIYLDGLYRLDPFFLLSRSRLGACVLSLRTIEDLEVDEEWMSGLLRSAHISDELVLMLPVPGGATIAVAVEREIGEVSSAEVREAGALLQFLDAIHQVHLERTFAKLLRHEESLQGLSSRDAMLVLDRNGTPVTTTQAWQDVEREVSPLNIPV